MLRVRKVSELVRGLLWWLKHPRLYPEFCRTVKNLVFKRFSSPDAIKEAQRWCEERAISTSEAIVRITGSHMCEPIREKFKDVFIKAEEVAKECSVEMGGPANLDLLYGIAEYLKAEKVIETGVAYGWSSLSLLLSLTTRDNALLVSTDMPYIDRNTIKYVGCVVPDELKSHWQIINLPDRLALPKALEQFQEIDMCHYDSDKSCEGRMWGYTRLWRALKSGGCFISDDIGDNLAFRDFCSRIDTDPVVVRMPSTATVQYAGILVKNK